MCEPHRCRCGGTVDALGLHPLSCRQSAGRFPRHKAINDIVKRALDAAGMHAILEPAGLDRGDGKRPDGITTFPFANGKCLAWDATCSDTFSPSALSSSAAFPGSKCCSAEASKQTKYKSLEDRFTFVPIAIETSGIIGPKSKHFLRELGHRITNRSGESKETAWLFQRISIAVVRGNNFAIVSACRTS